MSPVRRKIDVLSEDEEKLKTPLFPHLYLILFRDEARLVQASPLMLANTFYGYCALLW